MHKKDFESIARVIHSRLHPSRRREAALEFAIMLKANNPAFDKARFLKACGVDNASPGEIMYQETQPGFGS